MNKVPLTARGAEMLREELKQLKTVERPNVVEARVVRGLPVKGQFGQGFPEEQAVGNTSISIINRENITFTFIILL